MSDSRGGQQRGRGRGGDRARGDRGRGYRGGGGGRGSFDLPFRPGNDGRGDSRGRGRPRASDAFRGARAPRGGRGGYDGPPVFSPGGDLKPNPQVEKKEDEMIKALIKAPPPPEEKNFPVRPGYGTRGKRVDLFANYLHLKSIGKTLYRYRVEILEDRSVRKPTGKKAKQVIKLLIEEHFASQRNGVVTDFVSTLISRNELLEEAEVDRTYDVRYRDEYDDEYQEQPKVYRVKCQHTGTLEPSDLLDYLTSAHATDMFAKKPEILQAMNIVLGHPPKVDPNVYSVGANRHFAIAHGQKEGYNLGDGLEALRGFFVSVRAATSRLLVNVQVKYAACYQEGALATLITSYQPHRFEFHSLQRFLKNLRIRVTHIERKNKRGELIPRFKRIASLATTGDGASLPHPPIVPRPGAGPNDVKFWLDEAGQQSSQQKPASSKKKGGKKPVTAGPPPAGRYISVAAFFDEHHNIRNLDARMPVVNVGSRENPSYLPVEVCNVEPGQQAKTKLSPFQTRQMLEFAVHPPPFNAQSIVNNGTRILGLGAAPNATLKEFGIQADPRLITVPGRILDAPQIFYRDANNKEKQIPPSGGSWNMRSIRFSIGSTLGSWAWVFLDSNPTRAPTREVLGACLQQFVTKLREVGVQANPPKGGEHVVLARRDVDGEIGGAVKRLMAAHKPTMILGILTDQSTDVYNCMKRVCDVREGVRNVNVLVKNFTNERGREQYLANVGLKVNLKLGGANQLIPRELGIVSKGKTMLVGIDVTHPSPGSSTKAPSVAGMVASVDSYLGQWPAELRIQTSRQERVSELDTMLKAHLGRWAKTNKGQYPDYIIVYRDGVSEGQYEMVVQEELPLLKKACQHMYSKTESAKGLPRISVVVVGKRHHTRFYPTREEDADGFLNPKNGTVVDRGVTEARNWEFYLQAHTALKGTARPAHYFTVWDEIFCREKPKEGQNTADILEDLTHKMCYLFGRATKAVSICPPAYYADLVCERARCYLSDLYNATPTGSVVTGVGGGGGADTVDGGRVTIHPNVKDTMFYI
ncbi:Piwi-domain-containing protein [Aspergillus violaceofuscus CBS 115571]|uniref:Piwi-domain-containing protein n=1 Tax=Aspergillus violaceofuscus (strain CBS 115571) TaxID=1450538 RepID=A0A2V5IDZ0_ASPV1|nr:Piwi-domain-containing protein [Aspergillus violaceofuscus CBS 115571]